MAYNNAHTHDDPFWRDVLSGRIRKRVWRRRLFRLISPGARERCHLCLAPFDGLAAPLMRAMGRGPWRRNPQYCDQCERLFTECRGGAEVEIAVIYADVRGSTQLAAQMRPIEFGALMERFFIAATTILTAGGAAIDKMVGDKVIALYLPGLISDRHNYRRNAVRAGIELLRATGHAEAGGPWLPIGVGVHSGVAFVGSIGTERGTYEFAALGETMNLGARLVAAADTGEVVISSAIWPDVTGGNKYLRTLFIHGARAALPHLSERDTPLGRWVKGLLGRAHQNVVVVALANKLARIAWAVLRHGDAFEADKMPVLV